MSRPIGMDPETVRGVATSLDSQLARLDRVEATLGNAHRATLNPESNGIEAGDLTVAPWDIADLAAARSSISVARARVAALAAILRSESGSQEDKSKAGASVALASFTSKTQPPDDVDPAGNGSAPDVHMTADSMERAIERLMEQYPGTMTTPDGDTWDFDVPDPDEGTGDYWADLRAEWQQEIEDIKTGKDSLLEDILFGKLDDYLPHVLSDEEKRQIEILESFIAMTEDTEGRIILGWLLGSAPDESYYGPNSKLVDTMRDLPESTTALDQLLSSIEKGTAQVGDTADASYYATIPWDLLRDGVNYLDWENASAADRLRAALGTYSLTATVTAIDPVTGTAIITYTGYNHTTLGSGAGFRQEEWTDFLNEMAEKYGVLTKKTQYFGWQEVVHYQ